MQVIHSQPRFPEPRRQGIYVLPLCPRPPGPRGAKSAVLGMGPGNGRSGRRRRAGNSPGLPWRGTGARWLSVARSPLPLGTPGPRPAPPLLRGRALTSGEVSRRRAPRPVPPSRRSGAPGRPPEDAAGPAPGQAPPSSQPRPAGQVTSAFSLASGPPTPALRLLGCTPETLRLRGPSQVSV